MGFFFAAYPLLGYDLSSFQYRKAQSMTVPRGFCMIPVATLLFSLPAPYALADMGPALSGLTGSANDATSVFFSPAGITRLEEREIVIQTSLGYKESKFTVDDSTYAGGDSKNDQSLSPIPGLFYAQPLRDKWHLGLSLNVPSGVGNDYGSSWSGRYHMDETTLAFVAGTAVVAYEATDRLSLAGGTYAMLVASDSKVAVNNLLPGEPDGNVELEETGADIGFILGAMYEFTDSTRVGVTYRSELKPDLEGTPTIDNVDPLLRETLAAANLLGTEIDVDFTVPAQAQIGFHTKFSDRWSIAADWTWVDMSEFGITHIRVEQDSVSVPNDTFRDINVGSIGLTYSLGEDRAFSVGATYAESAVSNSKRDIALPLDRAVGIGAGLEMPFRSYITRINLSYFDLGDANVSQSGGPLTGDFSGSFDDNWALLLDFQFRKIF